MKIDIHPLPAFSDNYLWLLSDGQRAWVIDPGEAEPVTAALAARDLRLEGILLTHWHPDHIGGVEALRRDTGCWVAGPAAEQARMPALDHALVDGDRIGAGPLDFRVLGVPGHTLGHIAYHHAGDGDLPGLLFCGDTLFHTGCGRLFEGSPAQMLASLDRLAALPDATRIYCTHEYTLANLHFARGLEPDHAGLAASEAEARAARAEGRPTLPTTMALQKATNPFLRSRDPQLAGRIARDHGIAADDPLAVFATLRQLKDRHRAPAGL